MGLRPTHGDEIHCYGPLIPNRLRAIFDGVQMGLRRTHGNEKRAADAH
jgi:hypothetical protein